MSLDYLFLRIPSLDIGLRRPQFIQFPEDEKGFAMDDQAYLGDTGILIHPVVKKGATSVTVYLAEDKVGPFSRLY